MVRLKDITCNTLATAPGPEEELSHAVAVSIIRTWGGQVIGWDGAWWSSLSGLSNFKEIEHH